MKDMTVAQTLVLDEFEIRTDAWTFGQFEKRLEEVMGARYGNYQTGKMTIIEADRIGRWPRAVEGWVRSNFKAFGNLPSEMSSLGQKYIWGK